MSTVARLLVTTPAAFGLLMLVGACSGSSGTGSASTTGTSSALTSSAAPTGSSGSATSAGPPAAHTVDAGASDDGRTIRLAVGERLHLTLDSTYWQLAVPDGTVLHVVTAASTSPAPSCVPGGGCGTVTATFVAAGRGRTDVAAARSSCGEAMGCTGRTGRFVLHVVVT